MRAVLWCVTAAEQPQQRAALQPGHGAGQDGQAGRGAGAHGRGHHGRPGKSARAL